MHDSWYRVIDPLSPLFGCDVKGAPVVNLGLPMGEYLSISALRRVDVFVGNRPFQLVAPEGLFLGLLIDVEQLELSPIQDDVVELADDRPFGRCIDESEMTRADGLTLRIARYERGQQVALDEGLGGKLLASRTFGAPDGADSTGLRAVINMFADERPVDDITYELKRRD
jgi:hypothetical protein